MTPTSMMTSPRKSASPPVSPVGSPVSSASTTGDDVAPASWSATITESLKLVQTAVTSATVADAVLEDDPAAEQQLKNEHDGFSSSDDSAYITCDSDEEDWADVQSVRSLRAMAAACKDETLLRPEDSGVLTRQYGARCNGAVKKHPYLLVDFYHGLENRGILSNAAMVAVDRVFKVPLLAANGAEPAAAPNTWTSIQIDNVTEAEGLVILYTAARVAVGLTIEPESIAGSLFQNESLNAAISNRGVYVHPNSRRKFLSRILTSEDNKKAWRSIRKVIDAEA
jgi:hypothetical protein